MASINFNRQQAIADGWTDQQVDQYVAQERSKGRDIEATAPVAQQAPQQQSKSNGFVDALPTIGGIAGSFIPGFGLIGGGALGAGTGAVFKELLDDKEGFDMGNVAKEAALGGVGGAVGKGIGAVGSRLLPKITSMGNTIDDLGKGLKEGTRKIKTPASIHGASKEKAINQTLDKYGFKGTAQQQYEMLEPTMNRLEGEIGEVITRNPNAKANINDIKNAFIKKLDSSVRTGDLSKKQAQQEVNGYLNDLLKAAGLGHMNTKPGLMGQLPQIPKRSGFGIGDLDLSELRALKKLINQDYKSVQNAIDRGGSLTSKQKIINEAWGSLDDAVRGASPEMKALLKEESHLYQSARSLSGARVNPPTFRIAGTSISQEATQRLRDTGSAIAGGVGGALKRFPGQLPPIATQGTSQALGQGVVRLPFSSTSGVESAQDSTSNVEYQQGNNNGSDQLNHMPYNTTTGTQSQAPSYVTGYSPEQLGKAYMAAYQAGDTASAKQLETMYKFEIDHQENTGGTTKPPTAKQNQLKGAADGARYALQLLESGQVKTGIVSGRVEELKSKTVGTSTAQQDFQGTVAIARSALLNAYLGGNIPPSEYQRISAGIPSANDPLPTAKQKLRTFIREVERVANSPEQAGQLAPIQ